MQLFLLLYEYMYHGDVEPMYRILTGLQGPNHEQITTATVGKWAHACRILYRRPTSELVYMGRNTLALWRMSLGSGVYDRSVYTMLNLVWWLIGCAFTERHADPDVQIWMNDLYAEWRHKAGENLPDRCEGNSSALALSDLNVLFTRSFPPMEDLFGAINDI